MATGPFRLATPLSCIAGALVVQSCAAAPGATTAPPAPVTVVQADSGVAPPPVTFEASAPNEIISESMRSSRTLVVGDMLRLGVVVAVEQGPPGVLRTAVGNAFHTSTSREFYFPKLASAYYSWTAEGAPLVIELWDQGEKIGEFTDGTFLIGPENTTPRDCAGPGAAGICGYPPGFEVAEDSAAAPGPAPGAAAVLPAAESRIRGGRRGVRFAVGLGGGSSGLSCSECDFARQTAVSGFLSLEHLVADNVLLGIEGTGWTGDAESGSTAQVYSVMAVLTGYLNSRTGLFLRTGVGLVGYREETRFGDLRGNGLGFSGRLGYELGSGSVSFIPYLGYLRTFGFPTFRLDDLSYDYAELAISNIQVGLAVGIH